MLPSLWSSFYSWQRVPGSTADLGLPLACIFSPRWLNSASNFLPSKQLIAFIWVMLLSQHLCMQNHYRGANYILSSLELPGILLIEWILLKKFFVRGGKKCLFAVLGGVGWKRLILFSSCFDVCMYVIITQALSRDHTHSVLIEVNTWLLWANKCFYNLQHTENKNNVLIWLQLFNNK